MKTNIRDLVTPRVEVCNASTPHQDRIEITLHVGGISAIIFSLDFDQAKELAVGWTGCCQRLGKTHLSG